MLFLRHSVEINRNEETQCLGVSEMHAIKRIINNIRRNNNIHFYATTRHEISKELKTKTDLYNLSSFYMMLHKHTVYIRLLH